MSIGSIGPILVSRRAILHSAAVGVALAAGRPAASQAPQRPLYINSLGGIENPNLGMEERFASATAIADDDYRHVDARALADLRRSGLTAVNLTLGYVAGPMEPFEHTVREIGRWDALIRQHPQQLVKVYTAADIEAARDSGRVGIIYGFQNAVQLANQVDRVELFADLGVRILQLTYNPENALGGGSLAPQRGLTAFGHAVVERLNATRVLIDLSHSGEQICLEAVRASKAPVTISHTGCRALSDLPRNKTDAELRLVAERGGVVGIYFMPFLRADGHPTAEDVVAHIEHAVKVCGEDHVAIGTDGSVTAIDDLQRYRQVLRREVALRRAAGISAAGEGEQTFPFVVDLRGPEQFRRLSGLLAARGHGAARIDKILGQNYLRLVRQVWSA